MRARPTVSVWIAVTAWALSSQAADIDIAGAQALFDEAKRLDASGNHAEACPKFLASHRIDPKLGTLLNLATCYENTGKTASAWARFLEAIPLARRAQQPAREAYAKEHAAALERRLSRLVIDVASPLPNMTVKRDGIPVDAAAYGTAVPVDPGRHIVEAEAPGTEKWSATVDVSGDGAEIRTEIPPLEAETKSAQSSTASDRNSSSQLHLPRTLAWVAGGVGLVGVGIGSIYGLSANSKWSEAQSGHCKGNVCDSAGTALANDAKSAGNISTAMFIVGGAALAGGALLWFLSPPPAQAPGKAASQASIHVVPLVSTQGPAAVVMGAF